jgi:hypothetical protein
VLLALIAGAAVLWLGMQAEQ